MAEFEISDIQTKDQNGEASTSIFNQANVTILPPRTCYRSRSFFEVLPPEVRNIIYVFLVEEPILFVRDGHKSYSRLFVRGGPPVPSLGPVRPFLNLPLLLVSRLFSHEFKWMLRSMTTYQFEYGWDFLNTFTVGKLFCRIRSRPAEDALNIFPLTTNPFSTIRYLVIDTTTFQDFSPYITDDEVRRVTVSILNIIHFHMPSLKTCELHIDQNSRLSPAFNDFQPYTWFIKAIFVIPNPDRILLRCAGGYSDTNAMTRRIQLTVDAFMFILKIDGKLPEEQKLVHISHLGADVQRLVKRGMARYRQVRSKGLTMPPQ